MDGSNVLYNGERKVVFYEQSFEILHQVHVEQTGHGGRDAMRKHLKDIHGLGEYDFKIF
jgi:hypothetical protein